MEIVLESLRLANAAYTVLLVVIIIFWATVIIGVLDMETLDVDLDVDVDVDIDLDVDVDVDMDADMDVDADVTGAFNFWSWLNLGAVPFSLWLSIFGILAWLISMVTNAVLDVFGLKVIHELIRFAALSILIVPISAILTRFSVIPLRPAFKTEESVTNAEMVREICKITSSEVNSNFGLAEIMKDGAQILINVRAKAEEGLGKGDKALILNYNEDKKLYQVTKFDHEELKPS